KPINPESGDWKEFFWNPRTRELLGRTASSWGLILLFYLVFYTFLAGMFCLTMYVMLLTLDDYKPTWQDRLATPGTDPHSDQSRPYPHTPTLTSDKQVLKNDACAPDQYFIQEDSGQVRNNPKRSCQFNRTVLGECSGLTDRTYGYRSGKPCVLIKLNRVTTHCREIKDATKCGTDITDTDQSQHQHSLLSSPGQREETDFLGQIAYFPTNGTFNLMYYPYYGMRAQVNYSQPLVAVKFLNITLNADVNVECRINSNTIGDYSDRDKFAGRVSFKLRINSE
uniref:Sodium/potassium-transporting ATPase subunit beta-2 n=1 Tax=Electrophorus electricus TaxID=8005 RepID=A0A4W4FEG2_ELEEL